MLVSRDAIVRTGVAIAAMIACVAMLACGGDDGGEQQSATETETATTTTRTPLPTTIPPEDFTIEVGGLTISGHCRGSHVSGSPVALILHGNGGKGSDHQRIEAQLAERTRVCVYDRPGAQDGQSDLPAAVPRSINDVVAEAHGVLVALELPPPYFLYGHSGGGTIAHMFAQAYPEETAGFVATTPVPPYTAWIDAARVVETPEELESLEVHFYEGDNFERTDYTPTDTMLTAPLPPTLPYAIMFDEDCDSDTEFCDRVLEPLSATTALLAEVGEAGRFIWVRGAGPT